MTTYGPDIQHLRETGVRALISAAAVARAERLSCVSLFLVEEHLGGVDGEDILARLRAMRLFERLVAGDVTRGEELPGVLDRLCTAHLMSSPGLTLLRTSVHDVRAEGIVAAMILAVAADMLLIATSAVRSADGAELSFRAYTDDGWLMLAVETSSDACSVLPADGAAALRRLRTTAAVTGGVARRRWEDDRLGLAFTVDPSVVGSSRGLRASRTGQTPQ